MANDLGRGAMDQTRSALVSSLKVVVVDANELLQEMAGAAALECSAEQAAIEGPLDSARARLDGARGAMGEHATRLAGPGQGWVSAYPWPALGIAAGVGIVLGLLLARR